MLGYAYVTRIQDVNERIMTAEKIAKILRGLIRRLMKGGVYWSGRLRGRVDWLTGKDQQS